MKKTIAQLGLSLALGLGAPAAAMAGSATDWTGFYLGVAGNLHTGKITDEGCVGLCANNHPVNQVFATASAGYDKQFNNNMVLGVFGWAGLTPVSDSAVLPGGFATISGKMDFGAGIDARVGYANGKMLPYIFAGYEYVHGSVSNSFFPGASIAKGHNGVNVGLGMEYKVSENVSFDGRYTFSYLGKESYTFLPPGNVTTAGEVGSTFSIGVNYRF